MRVKQSDGDDDYFRKVVPLAITVWNASFLSADKQRDMTEDLIRLLDLDGQQAQALRSEVKNLIDWRLREFSDIKRLIVNYTITPSEHGLQLFVASTLPAGGGELQE